MTLTDIEGAQMSAEINTDQGFMYSRDNPGEFYVDYCKDGVVIEVNADRSHAAIELPTEALPEVIRQLQEKFEEHKEADAQ